MIEKTNDAFRSPEPILHARSLAIVGASEGSRWSRTIFSNLKKMGYGGEVYPINPRYDEIWGTRCYPNFASLPGPVDHAAVIVPAHAVLPILEEGVAAGLRSATVYASGIGEGKDPEIVARGDALRKLIRESGLTVAGPNCMGSNALHQRCYAYPNAELLEVERGSVALLSQSGGTVAFISRSGAERGVRYSYMISTGNEIGLDLADYINFMVDDPHTKLITLFMEGVRRPPMFMKAAARALEAGKPILALKTGKSQKSREAAQSHTGAVAGDYDIYLAMCERYGIVTCASLDDLVETTLAFQAGRLPRGNRVGVVTTSGGTVDLLHDYIAEAKTIETPALASQTLERLRPIVQADVPVANPLDAGIPTGEKNAADICKAVLDDPHIDMIAWEGMLPSAARPRDPVEARGVWDSTDKPVICFSRMYHMIAKSSLGFQDAVGIPFLQGLPQSVRALAALAFYGERAGRKRAIPSPPKGSTLGAGDIEAGLAAYGIAPPKSARVATPEEAAAAAASIGFPVALKIVSTSISHKTESGGVRLNLRSNEEVLLEARKLARVLGSALEGFLVQEMVEGVEVLLGARTDPLYGPFIAVGLGGIMVELTRDVGFCLLPLNEDDANNLVSRRTLATLLSGFRGQKEADRETLIRAIVGMSDFYLAHRDRLADLEINPLIVRPKGKGVCAVDIRPVFTAPERS